MEEQEWEELPQEGMWDFIDEETLKEISARGSLTTIIINT